MKEVKKRILTQVTVTFPELENFIDIFSITGLALLDKYPTAHHYKHSSVDRILKIFRHIQGNSFNNQKAIEVLELAKTLFIQVKPKMQELLLLKVLLDFLKYIKKNYLY